MNFFYMKIMDKYAIYVEKAGTYRGKNFFAPRRVSKKQENGRAFCNARPSNFYSLYVYVVVLGSAHLFIGEFERL